MAPPSMSPAIEIDGHDGRDDVQSSRPHKRTSSVTVVDDDGSYLPKSTSKYAFMAQAKHSNDHPARESSAGSKRRRGDDNSINSTTVTAKRQKLSSDGHHSASSAAHPSVRPMKSPNGSEILDHPVSSSQFLAHDLIDLTKSDTDDMGSRDIKLGPKKGRQTPLSRFEASARSRNKVDDASQSPAPRVKKYARGQALTSVSNQNPRNSTKLDNALTHDDLRPLKNSSDMLESIRPDFAKSKGGERSKENHSGQNGTRISTPTNEVRQEKQPRTSRSHENGRLPHATQNAHKLLGGNKQISQADTVDVSNSRHLTVRSLGKDLTSDSPGQYADNLDSRSRETQQSNDTHSSMSGLGKEMARVLRAQTEEIFIKPLDRILNGPAKRACSADTNGAEKLEVPKSTHSNATSAARQRDGVDEDSHSIGHAEGANLQEEQCSPPSNTHPEDGNQVGVARDQNLTGVSPDPETAQSQNSQGPQKQKLNFRDKLLLGQGVQGEVESDSEPPKPSQHRPVAKANIAKVSTQKMNRTRAANPSNSTSPNAELAPAERDQRQNLGIGPGPDLAARTLASSYADLNDSARVERVLGLYIEESHKDSDYWVRTWLERARHSQNQAMLAAKSTWHDKPTSVFSNMKPKRAVLLESERPSDVAMELKTEFLRPNNKQSKKPWTVKCESISTNTRDLPNYSHYVSIKNNILAPNDKVLHHWPYISEDPPEGIDNRFHEQYFIDKEDRQRKLCRMLQAETIADYVEDTIADLDCSWSDVLRFLLEASPDVGSDPEAMKARANRQFFCDEDFTRHALRWVTVLAKLPQAEPEKLGQAALLCEAFQRMTKFPLWHVARRCDFTKKLLADDEPEHSVDDWTCRVCMRFHCPYHGEIRQRHDNRYGYALSAEDAAGRERRNSLREEDGNGRDQISAAEEVVQTDIINPPQVNFRQAVCFPHADVETENSTLTARDRRSLHYWQTEFPNYLPEDRGPFYPCNHPGISCKSAECSCFRSKVPCEKSCACSADCPRKFQGCSCAAERLKKGQKLVCFEDERCLCYQLGRECDADLCGGCGVSNVLDPVYRYSGRKPRECCDNASLQRGVRKHTVLGESGVHGLGLYACEDIREHEYVSEYLGEIITIYEGERRGAVYEYQKLSYLFSLNKTQDIDGTCFGNKARFINHASKQKANLYARTRLVNTVYRVGLYATRNIKRGEELFFEYGDKFPDKQLEGKKLKKSAPTVRNTRLVRDEFYDVEQTVDEVGNRRARKVTANKPARPIPRGRRARNPSAAPASKTAAAKGGRVRKTAQRDLSPDDEEDKGEVDGKGDFDPAERLENYYVTAGDGPSTDDANVDVDVQAGAEDDDFEPEESDDEQADDEVELEVEVESEQSSEEEDPPTRRFRRARGRLTRTRRG